ACRGSVCTQRSMSRHPSACRSLSGSCPSSPFLFTPFFFGFALHGRCICVLHFEPVGRAAGTVGGILALRDDAFEAKLAGVGEEGRAVALLCSLNRMPGWALATIDASGADLQRIAPQVVGVQLDQVEGVEKDAPVSALVTDEIERGDAVDDAGARAQACQRLDDQREATSEMAPFAFAPVPHAIVAMPVAVAPAPSAGPGGVTAPFALPMHTNCACACGAPMQTATTQPSAAAVNSRIADKGNFIQSLPTQQYGNKADRN